MTSIVFALVRKGIVNIGRDLDDIVCGRSENACSHDHLGVKQGLEKESVVAVVGQEGADVHVT